MSATPEIADAFRGWKFAELASHYAQPCPDEVMNKLVDDTYDRLGHLASLPAVSADDLLLKLFPIVLAYFEPKVDDPPLLPVFDQGEGERDGLCQSIIEDFCRLSPDVARAMAAPHRLKQR